MYVIYLIVMSISLLLAAPSRDPRKYSTSVDKFRAFCETVTVLFAVAYLILEMSQMEK